MNKEEIIAELAEIMDVEDDALMEETELTSMDEWDSITKLAVIIFADEKLGKTIEGEELKKVKTLSDLLKICL